VRAPGAGGGGMRVLMHLPVRRHRERAPGAGGGRDARSSGIGKGEMARGWVAAGMHIRVHRETQELCTTSSLFLSWQLKFPVDCDHVCECLKGR
jgi:hypothetical protein